MRWATLLFLLLRGCLLPGVAGTINYTAVAQAIWTRLSTMPRSPGVSWAPTLLRLAWHSSGTYSRFDRTGGSFGATMRFAPERDFAANRGLGPARDFLEPLLAQFPNMSHGDLWVLASYTAVEYMGGPHIAFQPGRVDALNGSACPPDGRLPSAELGADHVRAVFGRMGFGDREAVALLGAHTVGRMYPNNTGYDGVWDNTPEVFDNSYFTLLLQQSQWLYDTNAYGNPEFRSAGLLMLNADLALVEDAGFRQYVELYAANQTLWQADFATAFKTVTELGCPWAIQAAYPPVLSYSDVATAIRAKLSSTLRAPNVSWAPTLLRLAWHSSGTYSLYDQTGGSFGATMRFAPERDFAANRGLGPARDFLEPLLAQFPNMSHGDLWVLASYTAVEYMGGPRIAFQPGRVDTLNGSACPPDGRLPSAELGADHVRAVFGRMGFGDREAVALLGAHTVGRMYPNNTGYDGVWDNTPEVFDNSYFVLLLQQLQWVYDTNNYSNPEFRSAGLLMLNTDMALVEDANFRKYVELYAGNQSLWQADFAAAFKVLTELGCPWAPDAAQEVCPAPTDACMAAPPTVAGGSLSNCGPGSPVGTRCALSCGAGRVPVGAVACVAGEWVAASARCVAQPNVTCQLQLTPLLQLQSTLFGDQIQLSLTLAQGSGWLAFGRGLRMVNSTVVLGIPGRAPLAYGPVANKTASGVLGRPLAPSSLAAASMQVQNGMRALAFQRAYTDPVLQDMTGNVSYVWAYGSKDSFTKHTNSSRGAFMYNFATCTGSSAVGTPAVNYTAVAEAVRQRLATVPRSPGVSWAPTLLRLAWHSSGTYSLYDRRGGSFGATMRFAPERDFAANRGLGPAREFLEPLLAQFPNVSHGDLWVLAGYTAVEYLGGPRIAFQPGRVDALDGAACPPDGRLPSAELGADHVRAVFGRMGFGDREAVALLGAHTVGRLYPNNTGYDGVWDNTPEVFDNSYFTLLLQAKWAYDTNAYGNPEFDSAGLLMLNTDMALVEDSVFRQYVEMYAANQTLWQADFARAFKVLTELGCPWVVQAEYPPPLSYSDVAMAIRTKLSSTLRAPNVSWAPTLLRLAWHTSGTYSRYDQTGGSFGATMRFAPERDFAANRGLGPARDFLEPLLAQFPNMSHGDLWVLAGYTAVEYLGGPRIAFQPGRVDALNGSACPPDGRLPSAELGADHVRAVFGRMGFGDREAVALLGAHTVGRMYPNNTGYDGVWDNTPEVFDNSYFALLLQQLQWAYDTNNYSNPEFRSAGLLMLNTDMALVEDPGFRQYVELYAANQTLWQADFATAFKTLTELGCPWANDPVVEDCDATVTAAAAAANCSGSPPLVAGGTLSGCAAGAPSGTACRLRCGAGLVASGAVTCTAGQWVALNARCVQDASGTCTGALSTQVFDQSYQLHPSLTLQTSTRGSCIVMRLTLSQSVGWLAFGLGTGMVGSTVVLAIPGSAPAAYGPISATSEAGVLGNPVTGSSLANAILDVNGTARRLTFQRSVQDPVLGSVNGTTSFVYAFGSTDSFGYHGSSRGVVALNVNGGSGNGSATPNASSTSCDVQLSPASFPCTFQLYSSLTLQTYTEGGCAVFRLTFAAGSGWLGFGVGGAMLGSRVVVGIPGRAVAAYGPISDTSADGVLNNPIASSSLAFATLDTSGGQRVLTFQRALDDAALGAVATGTQYVWALGTSDTFQAHFAQGVTVLDLTSCQASQASLSTTGALQIAHGVLMMLGPGLMIPLGALQARHRTNPSITTHQNWQMAAMGLMVAGLIIALVMVAGEHFGDIHPKLGISCVAGLFAQFAGGVARAHAPPPGTPKSVVRVAWEWAHFWTGRLLIVFIAVTVFWGPISLDSSIPTIPWYIAYAVGLGLIVVLGVGLEVYRCVRPRPSPPNGKPPLALTDLAAVPTAQPPTPPEHRLAGSDPIPPVPAPYHLSSPSNRKDMEMAAIRAMSQPTAPQAKGLVKEV